MRVGRGMVGLGGLFGALLGLGLGLSRNSALIWKVQVVSSFLIAGVLATGAFVSYVAVYYTRSTRIPIERTVSVSATGRTFRMPPQLPFEAASLPLGGVTLALTGALAAGAWRDIVQRTPFDPLEVVFAAGLTFSFGLVLTPIAFLARYVWTGGAIVTFSAEGLHRRSLMFSQSVPWDAISINQRYPNEGTRLIVVDVVNPQMIRTRGVGWLANMGGAPSFTLTPGIDATFVVDMIRWYARHPERRAAIGTSAERERLISTLGDKPPQASDL